MPRRYYALMLPQWLRSDARNLSPQTRREMESLGQRCRTGNDGLAERIDRVWFVVLQLHADWLSINRLLAIFQLSRGRLSGRTYAESAVRAMAQRMPKYVTLKEVKKRWGHGQADIFPVAQFEKLWGDMTAIPQINSGFFVVPLVRGQQLKHPAQLGTGLRDGSAAQIESLWGW